VTGSGQTNPFTIGSSTGAALLTVLANGNVGIGTTTPVATLDLVGTFTATATANSDWGATIQNLGTTNAHGLYVNIGASSTGIPFRVDKGGTALFSVINNGNVGIGTTNPSNKLTVAGNIELVTGANRFIQIGSASNYYYNLQSTGDDFQIIEGGDPSKVRLHIDYPNGNVGIGTTSPSRTLSVTGTVAFDGLTGATGSGSLCLDATSKEVVYNSGTDSCLPSLRETKHDITPLTVTGLDIINGLESVSFAYNAGDGRTRFGFIAEDAAAIDAHLATYDAEGGISGIDDRSVLSVMVKAVQELYARVLALVDTVTGHEERIVELEDEIATLKAQTAELLNARNPQGSGNGGDQEPPVVETPPEEPTPDGEPSPVEETPPPAPEPTPEVVPDGGPVATDPM
jgi:hypothetical protein